jgi:hypothetical protein
VLLVVKERKLKLPTVARDLHASKIYCWLEENKSQGIPPLAGDFLSEEIPQTKALALSGPNVSNCQ